MPLRDCISIAKFLHRLLIWRFCHQISAWVVEWKILHCAGCLSTLQRRISIFSFVVLFGPLFILKCKLNWHLNLQVWISYRRLWPPLEVLNWAHITRYPTVRVLHHRFFYWFRNDENKVLRGVYLILSIVHFVLSIFN